MEKPIELTPFSKDDFAELISEIKDPRFLLQWSGPKYSFPLDSDQLFATLADTTGEQPAYQVFKAVIKETGETAGHIQLVDIDYDAGCCTLGRVLIFKEYRNRDFGKELVNQAVSFAFETLCLKEVTLKVFDFNLPAIRTYKKAGFKELKIVRKARSFQDEEWNLIIMKKHNKFSASNT